MSTDTRRIDIEVEGLWKRYGLPPKEALSHRFKRYAAMFSKEPSRKLSKPQWEKNDSGIWSLRDISFTLRSGEILGVIGLNGSGKSTLLKVLSLTSPPTHGRVAVNRHIFSMIELSAGMHMELTGSENIRLLSIIMGFSPGWVRRNTPEIEAFCGLDEWLERPVWQYSSGMAARLAFAVAMYAEAEVLLIDEILAVGDVTFQKKCIAKVENLIKSGASVVFVSHNHYLVERLCSKVLWLHKGAMRDYGAPGEVVKRYMSAMVNQHKTKECIANALAVCSVSPEEEQALRAGTGDLRITRVEALDGSGKPVAFVETGKPVVFRLHYRTTEPIVEPAFSIRVLDQLNTLFIAMDSIEYKQGVVLDGEGWVDYHIDFFPLCNNPYMLQVKVVSHVLLDMHENALEFEAVSLGDRVLASTGSKGFIYTPFTVRFNESAETTA